MHKHHGRHNDPTHHAHILMYGSRKSHADGGVTLGNMASNTPHYKRGGRSRHAEGDMVGTNPITGQKSPDVIERRRGGRACHAEGDTVAVPYRHGGKTHRRHRADGDEVETMPKMRGGRACHNWGDFVHDVRNIGSKIGNFAQNAGNKIVSGAKKFGNDVADPFYHAEGDTVATPYRHGGKTHRMHHDDGGAAALLSHGGKTHRRRHAEGDTTQMMRRGGLKKKSREHHGFGETVGNIASTLLPLLPLLLKEGGSTDTDGAAKLAAGGAGKVRKGMLSRSGKPIPAPVHSPRHAPFRAA